MFRQGHASGNDADSPARAFFFRHLPELSVQVSNIVPQAIAVRQVADQQAGGGRRFDGREGADAELNRAGGAGSFRVGLRGGNRALISIRGDDDRPGVVDRRSRVFQLLAPFLGVEVQPVNEGKAAVEAGGDVAGHERRFDGKRAGAAKGIEQRLGRIVVGVKQKGGGQRLAQGRFGRLQAVAALVQVRAGRVQADGAMIVIDPDDHF